MCIRSLLLGCLIGISLVSACTTTLEYTRSPTATDLFLSPIAQNAVTTFTCVTGAEFAGSPAPFTRQCLDPAGVTPLQEWGTTGCTLTANFCQDPSQLNSYLATPTTGAVLGEDRTFTCQPGHQIYYTTATFANPTNIFTEPTGLTSILASCLSVDRTGPGGLVISQSSGRGLFAIDRGDAVSVPYCFPKPTLCPSSAVQYSNDMLTADQQLQFSSTASISLTDAWGAGLSVSTTTYLNAPGFADCRNGFLSGHSTTGVLCKIDGSGNGYWVYTDAPSVSASCVRRSPYCDTTNSQRDLFNYASVSAAPVVKVTDDVLVVCQNGYSAYPWDRETNTWPARCAPDATNQGQFRINSRADQAPPYSFPSDFDGLDFNGRQPCSLIWGFCDTTTSNQSPNLGTTWNYNSFAAGTLDNQGTINDQRPISCTEGAVWNWNNLNQGTSLADFTCRETYPNFFLSPASDRAKYGYWIPTALTFTSVADLPTCVAIADLCGGTYAGRFATVKTSSSGSGSAITGAYAETQVSSTNYYYDCDAGYSVGGTRGAPIPQVYCHATVIDTTTLSRYDITPGSGDWSTDPFPFDMETTTTNSWSSWSWLSTGPVITPPLCTKISAYCPTVDFTDPAGTITTTDYTIAATATRACADGFYPSSLSPPAAYLSPPITENLVCQSIPSDSTGQNGRWVQASTGALLGPCVRSPFYCPSRVSWSGGNQWKVETSGATTLDSSFTPVCLDGYTTTGVKTASRTLSVTCSVFDETIGCWKSGGTCDPQCVVVPNYCVAPDNVLTPANGAITDAPTTWTCVDGYTTDGLVASSNLNTVATCLPLVSDSTNLEGRWSTPSDGSDWKGCKPANNFCSLSLGVDTAIIGKVNDVADIQCTLGYKLQCVGSSGILATPQRSITGAVCQAVNPTTGTWRHPADPANCPLQCVQIDNFCPNLVVTTAAGILQVPINQEIASNGNKLQSTTVLWCPVGYAAAAGTAPTVAKRAPSTTPAVTRATATGPITTLNSITVGSPIYRTATCVAVPASGDPTTVSGQWELPTGEYPGCAVVTDFCTAATFPGAGPLTYTSTVKTGDRNRPGSAVDPAAGTATYDEKVFSRCNNGYAKDFFPVSTGGGYESKLLGTQRASGYQNIDGAYGCNENGDWVWYGGSGIEPGSNLCDPVQLCDLPTHVSLANTRCLAQASPCPFETAGRFFCSNGYLTQSASSPGWYDISPADRLVSSIAAVFDLSCSTGSTPIIVDSSVTSRLTWEGTVNQQDWTLVGTGGAATYQYSQQWVQGTTPTDPTALCIFQQNYCSLPGPFQSRFLTNVDTLTPNAGARAHGSILNMFRCQTGYEISYGNFGQQIPNPRIVEKAGLTCRPNTESVSPPILAGEWSLIQALNALPAQCVPIDGFCQYTNPTAFGTFSASVQTIGSAGTYCCQPGYKLATSAATSTSVTCTAPAGLAPSTWLQNGLWLAGGVAPTCVAISNYCSVGAVTTTSTPLSVDSISPADIFGSRTFSCSAGYQIATGVYSRSYACTVTDSSCGGASTGAFLSSGVAPQCTIIDGYCPSVRLTGTAANTIGLRIGQSSQVSCDLGFSVTGSSSVTPLSYSCAAGTSSAGVYTGNPQCQVSIDYCSAFSATLNVPTIQTLTAFGQQLGDRGFLTCDAAGYGIGGARGSNSVAVQCVTNPASPAFGKWVDPNGVDVSATTCSASNNTCLLSPLGTGTLSSNATGTTDQFATLTCPTGSTIGGVLGAATSALVRCNALNPTGWTLFGSSPLTLPTCAPVPQWCPSTATYNAAHPGATLTAASPYYFGTSGSVACANGYFSPDPATVVSCLASRVWQAPSCVLITSYCSVSTLGPLAAPIPLDAKLAEGRNVSCAIGYQFISGAYDSIPVTCAAGTPSAGVFKDGSGTDALCGPVASYCPSTVTNGAVQLAVTGKSEVGSQGMMNCDLGSSINNSTVTSVSVTCSPSNRVLGSWNQSATVTATCTPIDRFCGPVQLTASTQVTLATARYLDTYSLVCTPGYYGLGTNNVLNTLTCSRVGTSTLSGQWTVGSVAWGGCVQIPNYCPANVTGFKATLVQSPATGFVGSAAQFNCTAGTTSTGVKTASTLLDVDCGTSGAWVVGGVATAGCQTVIDYCSTSGTVGFGTFANPLGGALNQGNQFNCDLGYIVSSTNTATSLTLSCDISGSWRSAGSVFAGCVQNPNFCPNVAEPNASVNYTNGNAYGSGALVTCNPGYTGDGGRLCGANGQWSSTITCVDKNECLQVGACTTSQVCANTEGSYNCSDCTDPNAFAQANVCVCKEPIWVPGPVLCVCSCGLNALCSQDLQGNPVCVCPTGFVVNSTTGDCSPCGNLDEQCCASSSSCGSTGLICQFGFCRNPPVPAPALINVTQTPPAPIPAATPTGRTTAPPPSSTNSGGGSSSADDAASLSVLFALAFQLL